MHYSGTTDIRTDVELKLRLAGIKVVTKEESFKLAGSPYLYVNAQVRLSRQTHGLAHYAISCELHQVVTLTRDVSISTDASTWDASGVGLAGTSKLPDIRIDIRSLKEPYGPIHERLLVRESK